MAKKTPIEKLDAAIMGILEDYAGEIQESLPEVAEALGKKGVQALRSESKGKFPAGTGAYAKAWKSKLFRGRLSSKVIIYNDHYALPHLLEHGHDVVDRKGRTLGHARGRSHIASVADDIVEKYEKEVLSKL